MAKTSKHPQLEVTHMVRSERPVRPRFCRGQERSGDSPAKHLRPNFAVGQSGTKVTDDSHVGDFATGQEHLIHHPEWAYEGRFSLGQELLVRPSAVSEQIPP